VGGKKFIDKTQDYFPKTPWGSMGLKFFDFDNDGRMDLFVTDMHSDMMEEQSPDHEKEKIKSHSPDNLLGVPPTNSSLATRSITTLATVSSRRFPTRSASNNFGPGESAWATSTLMATKIFSSQRA